MWFCLISSLYDTKKPADKLLKCITQWPSLQPSIHSVLALTPHDQAAGMQALGGPRYWYQLHFQANISHTNFSSSQAVSATNVT